MRFAASWQQTELLLSSFCPCFQLFLCLGFAETWWLVPLCFGFQQNLKHLGLQYAGSRGGGKCQFQYSGVLQVDRAACGGFWKFCTARGGGVRNFIPDIFYFKGTLKISHLQVFRKWILNFFCPFFFQDKACVMKISLFLFLFFGDMVSRPKKKKL